MPTNGSTEARKLRSRLNHPIIEGGVGWACMLYADLIGHWDKRNRQAIEATNPDKLDLGALLGYAQKYGGGALVEAVRRGEGLEGDSNSKLTGGLEDLDDYFRCKIGAKSDLRDLFVPRFYFGCEADDPVNAWAFNKKANPMGAPPQRALQLGHRPLRRPGHDRRRPRGLRAGRARADHPGRLPRLHVHERGPVLGRGESGLLQGHGRGESGGSGADELRETADQVHQPAERRHARLEIVGGRLDPQRRHSGVAVFREPLADHLLGAEQVRLEHELVGYARRRLLALAVEPEPLHLDGRVGVTGALVRVVVEVVTPRAHRAEREREPGLARRDQALEIIAERHHATRLEVERAQCAAGARGARCDVVEEDARMIGHE